MMRTCHKWPCTILVCEGHWVLKQLGLDDIEWSVKQVMASQTWNLSKILHRRIFGLKILHPQFHLISTVSVRKNTKNEWKWRNLHRWQKFYTAAGTDGTDKFHLWPQLLKFIFLPDPSPIIALPWQSLSHSFCALIEFLLRVILRCWGNSSILCQQNSDAL